MAGRAKENLPRGSLKYLFIYLKVRIFQCSYRIYSSLLNLGRSRWPAMNTGLNTGYMEEMKLIPVGYHISNINPVRLTQCTWTLWVTTVELSSSHPTAQDSLINVTEVDAWTVKWCLPWRCVARGIPAATRCSVRNSPVDGTCGVRKLWIWLTPSYGHFMSDNNHESVDVVLFPLWFSDKPI